MADERERFEVREVAGKVMSKFLCYTIQSTNPTVKEPVSWCIMGDGKVWSGPTLEYTKQQVLLASPFAEFLEDCGWIFPGEEHKLLEPKYRDTLEFGLKLRGLEP